MQPHVQIQYKLALIRCQYLSTNTTIHSTNFYLQIILGLASFEFQSSCQMANLSFLLFVLALSLSTVFAADATTLQDFCVTNPIGQGIINKHTHEYCFN
jgi:hypothetical protein